MIEFPRDAQHTIPTSSVKIVGIGGAGANMVDRVALDGLDGAELLALNTDIRTLSSSVAGDKLQLGINLTKGLGTGGDPELGHQAVQEAEEEIRASLKGRKIVFICVGLGGGTGSGAAPIVARVAREEGAFVVMFATMPFGFEGRRRREQAETALNELAVLSNALVTFDNGRMGELVLAKQGIHEAFGAADRMISESIKAVIRLVVRPGLINIGLDDLMSALRTTRSRCLFGSGIATGKDRAQKALRNAMASPLLDQGALLKDSETVLVHLCGGEDLTLFEIELLMESLAKHVPESAQVLFGAAVDPAMGDQLSITLVSSLPEERLRQRPPGAAGRDQEQTPDEPASAESEFGFDAEAKAPAGEPTAEAPGESKREEAQTEPTPPAGPTDETSEAEDDAESADGEAVQPRVEADPESDPETDRSDEPADEPAELPVGKSEPGPDEESAPADEDPDLDREPPFAEEPTAPAAEPEDERSKSPTAQPELHFEGRPRGRFEGADPSVVEGEDLDVPAFLRKKRR